jgi:hypothetical protein
MKLQSRAWVGDVLDAESYKLKENPECARRRWVKAAGKGMMMVEIKPR